MIFTDIGADKSEVIGFLDEVQHYDAGEMAELTTDQDRHEIVFLLHEKYE